jgi:hypothetical protein
MIMPGTVESDGLLGSEIHQFFSLSYSFCHCFFTALSKVAKNLYRK